MKTNITNSPDGIYMIYIDLPYISHITWWYHSITILYPRCKPYRWGLTPKVQRRSTGCVRRRRDGRGGRGMAGCRCGDAGGMLGCSQNNQICGWDVADCTGTCGWLYHQKWMINQTNGVLSNQKQANNGWFQKQQIGHSLISSSFLTEIAARSNLSK